MAKGISSKLRSFTEDTGKIVVGYFHIHYQFLRNLYTGGYKINNKKTKLIMSMTKIDYEETRKKATVFALLLSVQ